MQESIIHLKPIWLRKTIQVSQFGGELSAAAPEWFHAADLPLNSDYSITLLYIKTFVQLLPFNVWALKCKPVNLSRSFFQFSVF